MKKENEIKDVDVALELVEEITKRFDSDTKKVFDSIGKIYDAILPQKMDYKIENLEQADMISDLTIDSLDFSCITIIRNYSRDSMDAPYQPSQDKLNKIKKHFTRMLIEKRKDLMDIFKILFIVSYITPLHKAQQHRGDILKEKKEQNPENN